jgi:anti-anti-sigma factor
MTERAHPRGRSLGSVDVVELDGELDLASAEIVHEALSGTSAPTVVVDLGRVAFLDSAGLRALDSGNRELEAAGRRLVIVAPAGSRAAFTFRVAGFPDEAVYESVEDALRTAETG